MSTDVHESRLLSRQRQLLSVRQTAAVLGVTEKTVRRLIAAGDLPAFQLGAKGSSIRIPADELSEWLESDPQRSA
jgi:excisionase family DNA binding protein